MKLKEFIHTLLEKKNNTASARESSVGTFANAGTTPGSADQGKVGDLLESNFLDGMSTATARVVIDRSLPENFKEIYDIEELQNQGRYYIAKIVQPGGKIVTRLLVDKLNGTLYYPKGRFNE